MSQNSFPLNSDLDDAIFLLLETAGNRNVLPHIYQMQSEPDVHLLYTGTPFESVLDVSPCLVRVDLHSPLLEWYLSVGMQENAGVLLTASKDTPTKSIANHLAAFLEIELPPGKVGLFRFYDPLVLEYTAFVLESAGNFKLPLTGYYYPVKSEDGVVLRNIFSDSMGFSADPAGLMNYSSTPLWSLDEQAMERIDAGAHEVVRRKIYHYLQEHFPENTATEWKEDSEAGIALARQYRMEQVSTMYAIAHVVAFDGALPTEIAEILADTERTEASKRLFINSYIEKGRV